MKHFVAECYFDVVADVNDTWSAVKRSSGDYRKDFGIALFTRMFEFAPAVWREFPWGHGIKNGENLMENKAFLPFVTRFVSMLDRAIDMLGPDVDWVEEQLQHLGIIHTDYGLLPKHYTLMGRALLDTLEATLGAKWTTQYRDSWNTIYTFMSVSMMQGAFVDMRERDIRRNEAAEITN